MLQNLGGWHLLIILAIVVLIFGAAKLPALAKSVGQSVNIFKGEMKANAAENAPTDVPVRDVSVTPVSSQAATTPAAVPTAVPTVTTSATQKQ